MVIVDNRLRPGVQLTLSVFAEQNLFQISAVKFILSYLHLEIEIHITHHRTVVRKHVVIHKTGGITYRNTATSEGLTTAKGNMHKNLVKFGRVVFE